MKKYFAFVILAVCISRVGLSQDTTLIATDTIVSINEPVTATPAEDTEKKIRVYKLKPWVDVPVTAVGTGWSLYAFTKIYSKDRLTLEEVQSLDPRNVNRFDRPATRQFNESISRVGDYLFYGSMPLPILFLIDKETRRDFPKLSFLYLEAMGITGLFYTGSVYFADRYRPYAYNTEAPLEFRMRGGARNSFFAGHPALVGTSTFFMASVFDHYHPQSKSKWLFYTLATVATGTTTFARYKGGRHFPSDLIIGTVLGPTVGMLIPRLHYNKDLKKRKTTVLPFFGESSGLAILHKF